MGVCTDRSGDRRGCLIYLEIILYLENRSGRYLCFTQTLPFFVSGAQRNVPVDADILQRVKINRIYSRNHVFNMNNIQYIICIYIENYPCYTIIASYFCCYLVTLTMHTVECILKEEESEVEKEFGIFSDSCIGGHNDCRDNSSRTCVRRQR